MHLVKLKRNGKKIGYKNIGVMQTDERKGELVIQFDKKYAEDLSSKDGSILWEFFIFVRKFYPEAVMSIIEDPISFNPNKTQQNECVYINLGKYFLN